MTRHGLLRPLRTQSSALSTQHPRRKRLWAYRLGAWLAGLLAWAALPLVAGADNCSSLTDCYGTVASGLAATVGIALVLATVVSLPSILASLEDLAAKSLGHAPPGGDPTAPTPETADLTRAPEAEPTAATSMARAQQPGVVSALDGPGMPFEGSQASLRLGTAADPGAGTPATLPTAAAHPVGGGADLSRGVGVGPHPTVAPTGHDSQQATNQQDLSRAATQPSVTGAESGRPQPPDDLSRTPLPSASTVAPDPATNLNRGGIGGGAEHPLSAGQQPGYLTPRLPMMNAPESARPDAGLPQALAPAPPPVAASDAGTHSQQAGVSQIHSPQQTPGIASAGGDLSRHGGGAESQGAQQAGALGRTDPAAPDNAGANDMARGNEGHVAGDPPRPPAPLPTGAEPSPVAPRETALESGQPLPAARAESGPALTGAAGLGMGSGGADLGATIANQVLARGESLDHVAQLDLALRGASTTTVSVEASAGLASSLLHGLGLDAGVAIDTASAILIPAGDGQSMIRFGKATGSFELVSFDPRLLTLLSVGATISFEPSRGRTAFGRYLRWVQGGAPSEWLARDPDLAAIRAAGVTIIGQTTRAAVVRVVGDPDQQWATGTILLAYRLPEWSGYLYIFEFDTAETLRSQGFVAEQRPAQGTPLAIGMTRDMVWAQLGAPGASERWWPFERWRYQRGDGHIEVYEFVHGILRARFVH